MNDASLASLDAYVDESAIELFSSHGIAIESRPVEGSLPVLPIVSSIGFTSARLMGALVLSLDRDVAAACLPPNLRLTEAQDGILADWTGELSNQLLGRLKNRLHAAGIDIALSTPIVFVGREMHHFPREPRVYRRRGFVAPGGAAGGVGIEFKADFEEDFEILETGEGSEAAVAEGEALFF
jgi:hypothetical protein